MKGNPKATKESNAILFGGIAGILIFLILFFSGIDYALPIGFIAGVAVLAFFLTRKEKLISMRV